MELIIVLLMVLIVSPVILKIAAKQDKNTKNKLRFVFQVLLLGELASGLLNWENLAGDGRSGFEFAIAYPASYLWVFFVIALVQIILLIFEKPVASAIAAALSFANTIMFFVGIILISGFVGRQVVGFANIAAIFLVLIGNVVGLVLANKDKNLLAKWPYRA